MTMLRAAFHFLRFAVLMATASFHLSSRKWKLFWLVPLTYKSFSHLHWKQLGGCKYHPCQSSHPSSVDDTGHIYHVRCNISKFTVIFNESQKYVINRQGFKTSKRISQGATWYPWRAHRVSAREAPGGGANLVKQEEVIDICDRGHGKSLLFE